MHADHYDKYLDRNVDFVIIGEGEMTLKELINKLDKNENDFETIDGLAFRKDGKTIKTSPRQILKELGYTSIACMGFSKH